MQSRYVDRDELEALRRSMTEREWLPFQISAETGLRIGDVVKIRPGDLDGRRLRYVAQKTGKPGEAILRNATAARLEAFSGAKWCFPSPVDPRKHISRQTLWRRLKKASVKAGVSPDGVSPHSLRKFFGVEEYHRHGAGACKRALQHSQMTTTEIYALADFCTGDNAKKPLTRADLHLVLRFLAGYLKG